jgi:hypothetical protein
MKIRYTSGSRLTFESEVPNPKEAVDWIATMQELFEESACGMCGKSNICFDVREYDGNRYYKMRCRDCYATLDFGQKRDGEGLFIKRKDAENNYLPNNGWYKYQGGSGGGGQGNGGQSQGNRQPQRPSVQQQRGQHSAPQTQYSHQGPADQDIPFLWTAFIPWIGLAASSFILA